MQPYDRNADQLRATVRKFRTVRRPARVRPVRTTMGARRKREALLDKVCHAKPEGSTS